jgi:hypothetical protein
MIRQANKFDLPYFIEATKKLHAKEHNKWSKDLQVDDTHMSTIFQSLIHGQGIVLVYEKNNKPCGMIIGLINPFFWAPETNIMYQILFHIDDVKNKAKIGYELIKAYNKAGDELMKNNRIYKYAFTMSEPMFDIDMTKFNYKMVEKTWVVGE